jgi:hypothetical protein
MSDERETGSQGPSEERSAPASPVRVGVGTADSETPLVLPETLPALPLKNTVLFPALLSPLLVNTARSKRLIDHVLVTPDRLLVAPAVQRRVEGSPGPDDVHRVATVLRNDPATGVIRHADAGYPEALRAAREHGLRIPLGPGSDR